MAPRITIEYQYIQMSNLGTIILRPVLQASRPSQTMATMGPLSMSVSLASAPDSMESYLTSDETLEERLLLKILIMRLEMLLGGRDHL